MKKLAAKGRLKPIGNKPRVSRYEYVRQEFEN